MGDEAVGAQSVIPTTGVLGQRAWELYDRLRPSIETPENIGKLIVMDVDSGDYEIDDAGMESSRRLQSRHLDATLYALRICNLLRSNVRSSLELS